MTEHYIGELRLFPYDQIPKGWVLADGRLLKASQNQPLFSVLGFYYGGDRNDTFALPDLRGRVPLGAGIGVNELEGKAQKYVVGDRGGAETVVLEHEHLPSHDHAFFVNWVTGKTGNATDAHLAAVNADDLTPPNERFLYRDDIAPDMALNRLSLSGAGGFKGHDNMQPFVVAHYCICVDGRRPQAEAGRDAHV